MIPGTPVRVVLGPYVGRTGVVTATPPMGNELGFFERRAGHVIVHLEGAIDRLEIDPQHLAVISPGLAERVARDRGERQRYLHYWARAAFSVEEATSIPQRGLRLLEEAVEAYQACGGDLAVAHKLVDFVFNRPPGEIGCELGGVGVTALLLAEAAGLSADAEEQREVARVLSKPVGEFTERNKAKNEAGFLITKPQ